MAEGTKYEIMVKVHTTYLPEQSDEALDRYVFAYTIILSNTGTVPAQLISRHWIIADGGGASASTLASVVWLEQTKKGTFERRTLELGTPRHPTLAVGDVDADGTPDLVLGNLGLNAYVRASGAEPARLRVHDFGGTADSQNYEDDYYLIDVEPLAAGEGFGADEEVAFFSADDYLGLTSSDELAFTPDDVAIVLSESSVEDTAELG